MTSPLIASTFTASCGRPEHKAACSTTACARCRGNEYGKRPGDGFDAQLDAIYGADLAGAFDDKKDLLAHLLASEALDPIACVMIGDRGHDMRAAGVNRVRALGVLWGYGSREELLDAGAGAH